MGDERLAELGYSGPIALGGRAHRGRYSAPHAAMVSAFQLAGTASFVQAVRVDRAARLGLRGGTFPKTVS